MVYLVYWPGFQQRCPSGPEDVRYPGAVLLTQLVERALRTEPPSRDEALAVLRLRDAETPSLVAEVSRVEAVEAAGIAVATGATRFCMVASGRGPTPRELERFTAAVRAVRTAQPHLEVCACLGLLGEGQAERLAEAGVHAYNHNLNTSEGHYERICATHTYGDRVGTLRRAAAAGLSPCSGALFGMGETDEDVVDVGLALRGLRPDSVPVNFLIPIEGTPLEAHDELTPWRCLRILALFRLLFPDAEVRIAGGREVHLRSLQPLGLLLANSIFAGDYLTTRGQAARADLDMIADMGLRAEGAADPSPPRRRPARPALKTERR